jgi:hypothetical protein
MTLKVNSKRTLDIIATQDKTNASQAYKQTHPNASDSTARTNASALMRNPEAQIYLQKHVDKATTKIVELVDSSREDIALKASESILDRQLGKPITKTHSINLNLSIEEALNSLE